MLWNGHAQHDYASPNAAGDPAARLCDLSRLGRDRIDALLVESDSRFLEDLAAAARRSRQLDFRLTSCRSLAEAEQALGRATPDVIYLDCWLGEGTSIPLIHRLAARGGAPCVMVSSLDEPEIRRIAFRAGARAFLWRGALSAQALDGVTMAALRSRFAPAG